MDMISTVLRRVSRAFVLALGLAVGLAATPAQAEAPNTWETPDNGSVLENLLILVGIPLGIVLLLTLLVYLPSMIKGQSHEPSLAFQERSEWFGGPRKGVGAAPETTTAEDNAIKGGASARW